MKKRISWLLLFVMVFLAACTVEKETNNVTGNGDGGKETQEARQEVLLTFKNKLAITDATTKAADAPVATVAENAITSLDIYVFASGSETGNYTFQERLSYRENEAALPAGSKDLTLEAGSKENEFTALLSLQKGLFVKLYCIANQPLLVALMKEMPLLTLTFNPLFKPLPVKPAARWQPKASLLKACSRVSIRLLSLRPAIRSSAHCL